MFTGRRFDIETGLYYYRARYYNPHIGRFMQTDPVGYNDGINWYLYCNNNPLGRVDPSGLDWSPYGVWQQEMPSSCGAAAIINMLDELFPDANWVGNEVNEAYVRAEFEAIIDGFTSDEIWGWYDEDRHQHGGRGVRMEESLQVLNKILRDKETGKKYKMLGAGEWDLGDWGGIGKEDNNMEYYAEKGPILFQGNHHGYAHAVCLRKIDKKGKYIVADSLSFRPWEATEKMMKQYLGISVRNPPGSTLEFGNNSWKTPILVPDW